ncbi:MAG: hypothetical protein IJ873_07760 [Lachnospiraceae bacterium]|nr:hypothetical protein [Lachnospiraceae bacterium]
MLNEERIRLMTHMAAYEAGAGKRDISINEYFRGDYLSFQVWKSAIYGIIGFFIVIGLNVLYDFNTFLTDFYKMDILEYFKDLAVKFGIFIAVYVVVSYFIYAYRYYRVKKHLDTYIRLLNELYSMYSEQER